MLRDCQKITFVMLHRFCVLSKPIPTPSPTSVIHISLPIGTNGKQMTAIDKFPSVIGKLMIAKTLAGNGEEITNAMTGNDELANY